MAAPPMPLEPQSFILSLEQLGSPPPSIFRSICCLAALRGKEYKAGLFFPR